MGRSEDSFAGSRARLKAGVRQNAGGGAATSVAVAPLVSPPGDT
jgi:hypothetical protein